MPPPLRVPPGPGVPGGLEFTGPELTERFSHSGGPGGQGVNTSDSSVQLSLALARTPVLDEVQRARVLQRLASRLVDGSITVEASEHRSQARNRAAARERLAGMLAEALSPPPRRRRATRPTRGSVERRLDAKRRVSQRKAGRRGAWE